MDASSLEGIGLSRNEAKAYLGLLGLGETTVTPLVREAGVPNSKVYVILEKLIAKGLASSVQKRGVRHYQAAAPEAILEFLQKRKQEVAEQESAMQALLPQLQAQQHIGRQYARVYEGTRGVKAAFRHMLFTIGQGGSYKVLTLERELESEQAIQLFKWLHTERNKQKTWANLIVPESIRTLFKQHYNYPRMRVRHSTVRLPTGIFIFGESVLSVSFEPQSIAFLINSKNHTKNYHRFFDDMWKQGTE